ncbi:MAG: hypothetical protein WBG50_27955 [Desulfomonilaceae bacterium]
MVKSNRTFKLAALGSASANDTSPGWEKAVRIGKAVGARGEVLLTGACPGFPYAATLGANSAGGLTVGISPAMNRDDHATIYSYPLESRITLFTGMGAKGRNVILIRSADACVFIGGGMGTLNEFTIACADLGPNCAIGILTETGGFSDEFLRLVDLSGKSPSASLFAESDPEMLVEKLLRHIARQ